MSVSFTRAGARARRLSPVVLSTLLLVSAIAVPARAAVTAPALELLAPEDDVVLRRYGGTGVPLQLGLYVAATGAPFELRAQRPDYTQPQTLTQVLHGPAGETENRPLDPAMLAGWKGLAGFFDVTFTDETGATVATAAMDFCPGGYTRERVDDSGPDQPTYPSGCFSNPFTKGVVWGIDRSWAVGVDGYEAAAVEVPNGEYAVTVAIAPEYVEAFAIPPDAASVQLTATVKGRVRSRCRDVCPEPPPPDVVYQRLEVPVVDPPDPATLPDLLPLPSWGIHLEEGRRKTRLTFGATVWTAGGSDLVVEGFRRSGEAKMDAYQYFYENGEVVGKAAVGGLEFDERDGHHHWHFKQFAGYSLLDAEQEEVRVSRKEAFCLAPTDAIDLTLPHAALNPSVGLSTACGNPSSIWVREILPLGWGDTYFQGLPGQSFDVTDLPNGTYYIRVEANPGGLLHEQSTANNVELREIRLKGRPGNRRVVVPPWNGIDSEAETSFFF